MKHKHWLPEELLGMVPRQYTEKTLPHVPFTKAQMDEIRVLLARGANARSLGAKHGVSHALIWMIQTGNVRTD